LAQYCSQIQGLCSIVAGDLAPLGLGSIVAGDLAPLGLEHSPVCLRCNSRLSHCALRNSQLSEYVTPSLPHTGPEILLQSCLQDLAGLEHVPVCKRCKFLSAHCALRKTQLLSYVSRLVPHTGSEILAQYCSQIQVSSAMPSFPFLMSISRWTSDCPTSLWIGQLAAMPPLKTARIIPSFIVSRTLARDGEFRMRS